MDAGVETSPGPYLIVFLWAAFASVAPLVSLLLPLTLKQVAARGKNGMLAVTAGMLLAIATMDLIPEAVDIAQHFPAHESTNVNMSAHEHAAFLHTPLMGVGLGFFCLFLMERLMNSHGHLHLDTHEHNDDLIDHVNIQTSSTSQFTTVAMLALVLHSFLDGFVIAGAFRASESVGTRVAFAILLHKLPDGFVAVTVSSGQRDWRRRVRTRYVWVNDDVPRHSSR